MKPFDRVIEDTIAEVLLRGFCMDREILAAGPGERLRYGRAPFLPWGHLFVLIPMQETYER